jgi:hypothetical protein
VREAETRFRRERRLTSADELRAWLDARHLTVADWRAYIRRLVAGGTPGPASATPGQVVESIWAEGICDGTFDACRDRLAAGAAARADTQPGELIPPPDWFERTPSPDEAARLGIDPAEVARRIARIWAGEVALERFRDEIRGSDGPSRWLAANNLDWLAVDYEMLGTGSEDAAREAALLVRQDGLTLAAVGDLAGVPATRDRHYLGDLPAELRPQIVSAAPGELIGPLALADGPYALLEVHGKTEPTLDDPEMRSRAEAEAIGAATARLIDERIVWHEHGQ